MENFKQSTGQNTKVNFTPKFIPTICVEREALNKMHLFVDECSDEIGWMGTATYNESENSYTVHDVFLFDQDVHSTTTEITPEGLSSFAEELLQRPDGVETWNNLKVWGHSHVRMPTSPSGQDDKQMDEFSNIGHDWFIRIIANKLGSFRVDLYNYKLGVTYLDVAWELLATGQELEVEQRVAELFQQITELEGAITTRNNQQLETKRAGIKAEMAQKVKKIVHNYKRPTAVGTKPYNYPATKNYKQPEKIGYNKTTGKWDNEWDDGYDAIYGGYVVDDMIIIAEDVMDYLDISEVVEITKMRNIDDLESWLADQGYGSYFSNSDLHAILRFAPGLATKYKGA